ncbi:MULTISPECIES: TetR family transcriptional regulator [unclassified Azospirillum]|jgi:AcrR family transcriptional regulator|uniref:TetR family transcriptional regulator n=1 Tax=unclassified Azospirillum TaxID=2630922 RepID=UPI000B6549F5|nr:MULTISPECIES: TetR family transcriptional regulator [unclassified Azospirillum]SNR98355.1 transcriptional regulator, TetR family [Azospirillum sp. RU38E]SNS15641.1 transcriptional regulator, TetR family [Azospirillum sp. RU37A]
MSDETANGTQTVSTRDDRQAALAAAMELIARQGWRETSLKAMADQAGLPLDRFYRLFPSRLHLLAALDRHADELVLAQPVPDPDDPPHDRLFDVLMRRIDVLEPFRPGLRVLARNGVAILAAPALAPGLLRSMGWMLEAAGLGRGGVAGALQRRGLATVWLATLRVWLEDESPDKSTTMAALDRHLKRAHELWNSLPLALRSSIGSKHPAN